MKDQIQAEIQHIEGLMQDPLFYSSDKSQEYL